MKISRMISRMQVLRLKPGDVIFVSVPRKYGAAQIDQVFKQLRKVFSDDHRVVVHHSDIKTKIVRPKA